MSPMRPGRECSMDGCEDDASARGWCPRHYQRWRKHGDVHYEPAIPGQPCSVSGCFSVVKGRGLCETHYMRLWRRGTTALTRLDADARFMAKIQVVEDCWTWTGERDTDGYGYFWADRKRHRAHRWAYQRWIGPIPGDLTIDHVCRVRSCVNPAHLEAVTVAENVRRWSRTVTHCPQGHLYDEDNTRTYNGKRQCILCAKERKAARRALATGRS